MLDAIGWEGGMPGIDVRLELEVLPRALLMALRAMLDILGSEKGDAR